MAGMQFPYPRKSSTPSTYTPARGPSYAQRRKFRNLAIYMASGLTLILLLLWLFGDSSSTEIIPPGTPEVVIVTTFDPQMSEAFKEGVKDNRRHYAAKHGYATFFPNTTDYDVMPGVPKSWSTVPAMRHAMTLHPHSQWLWFLSASALIMDTSEDLYTKVLEPRKLESMMIVDKPVVPPDSVIKTFSHLRGERIDFILTQDREGLAGGSLLVRTGEWAKFFLDAWYDPLYRSYNFQKAENHALEHIVQWHGTILAKLALIPQKVINSYTRDTGPGSDSSGTLVREETAAGLKANEAQVCTAKVISWPMLTAASATKTAAASRRCRRLWLGGGS